LFALRVSRLSAGVRHVHSAREDPKKAVERHQRLADEGDVNFQVMLGMIDGVLF
jgi:hypothetical protein